ncbi:MAG TPA: DUF4157 domain-containing protein [Acidimicrobiales bacterium]|nr:DUF4157 domain-containing protein [Acidimicrobiales bacterium]
MRWPFRSKSSPSTGGEAHASSDDDAAPAFASSRPGNEWASLPPAPIAISSGPPRTIAGSTSTIRRPIGLREHSDVAAFAAVGVVDGLARVAPPTTSGRAGLPEVPLGEASDLPALVARSLRAIASSAPSGPALTISAGVPAARPPVDPPHQHDTPARDRVPAADLAHDSPGRVNASRSSLAQSRRLGLGPGYHGALPDAIRQDRLERTTGGDEATIDAERVPDDLRTVMRAAYGYDVGDQLVHRGSDVSEEAQLGAQAFARDGEVFVPTEAGPLDEAKGKSLLAHELTHLAQQRRRTAPLPAEGSPEGLALEAEAQRAERFVRGDPGAPAPGPMRAPSDRSTEELANTQRFVNDLVHRGVAESDGSGGVRFLWGHGSGAAGRVQRATEPAGAAAQQSNWDVAATLGHSVAESIAGDFEEMIGGEFSFITGIDDDLKAAHEARDREFRREQTKEAFGRLRLEHLRVAKRQEAPDQPLSESQERVLKEEVDIEVVRRTDALEFRVRSQLDQVNDKLASAGRPSLRQLDPNRYDAIFNKLFAEPVGDLPDDDSPADVSAYAEQMLNNGMAIAPSLRGAPAEEPTPGVPVEGPTPGVPAAMSTEPTLPMGSETDAGTELVIDSWSVPEGASATHLVVFDVGELDTTSTENERPGIYEPAAPSNAQTTDGSASPATPVSTSAPPATGPAPGGSETKLVGPSGHEKIDIDRLDLEELTKRLFPRLRSSLRQELIVDRERAGRLNH